MTFEPVTVTPDVPVLEARRLMRRRGVRHLPVVDDGRVIGMLSDRDVRVTDADLEGLAGAGDVARVAGADDEVRDVMSAPVHLVREGASVEEAARLMLSRRISAVPVVTESGTLVGLLTTTDCLLAFLSRNEAEAEG